MPADLALYVSYVIAFCHRQYPLACCTMMNEYRKMDSCRLKTGKFISLSHGVRDQNSVNLLSIPASISNKTPISAGRTWKSGARSYPSPTASDAVRIRRDADVSIHVYSSDKERQTKNLCIRA